MSPIIPAILTNSIEEYKQKIALFENTVSRIQIDIVDGIFANNHTITLDDIASISTSLFLEAHLMVRNPDKYIADCSKAKIGLVTFHLESCSNNEKILDIIKKIKYVGMKTGIALNPETPADEVISFLDQIDTVLIMGVHPGFQGQKFLPETLKKVKQLRACAPTIEIEVDGGINKNNAVKIIEAGANYLLVNSELFRNGLDKDSVLKQIEALRRMLNETRRVTL